MIYIAEEDRIVIRLYNVSYWGCAPCAPPDGEHSHKLMYYGCRYRHPPRDHLLRVREHLLPDRHVALGDAGQRRCRRHLRKQDPRSAYPQKIANMQNSIL